MDPVLRYTNEKVPEIIDWIGRLVEIESPSNDPAAVNRAVDFMADHVAGEAKVKRHRAKEFGDHLRLEFHLPGRRKQGQVLGLGHLDTVYPLGTLDRMPFKRSQGRLWGPGVFDMKSGVVYFVFACRALRELDIPVRRRFVAQLNSDEEVGSPSSRPHTEKEAKKSAAVLVAEPSAGPAGNIKTGRKGGGGFRISVKGIASHAGLDFASGASAIVELARQIDRVAGWTDLNKGITVSPGVMSGGTATNVVAEDAWVDIDVRVPRTPDARRLEKRFAALKPFDRRTKVTVEGGLRRPPMERNRQIVEIYRLARRLSGELGVELGEAQVGGGSDGNFTAAMGLPTLDGVGAVGEGAHSVNESILIDRIADRVALIAKLIAAL
ncbi:MAG TPA: M20 family metallopeptidase [Bryobacterales bacterium]|nr:M20 family metallopeptidase [Bryobacterales bacterium]